MRISFSPYPIGTVPNPWKLGTKHQIRKASPLPVTPVIKAKPSMEVSGDQHVPGREGIQIDLSELLDYAKHSLALVSSSHLSGIIYDNLSPAEQRQMHSDVFALIFCQKAEERSAAGLGEFVWTGGLPWSLPDEHFNSFDPLPCQPGQKLEIMIINGFNATGLPRDAKDIAGTIAQLLRQIRSERS